MPKKAKSKRSKGKRGPKEERLIIKSDPKATLAKLLKKRD
jgi:hypothetical protein